MSRIELFMYGQQEIIAKIDSETDEKWVLESPRVLQVHMTKPGEMGIAIIPFFAGNPDGLIEIRRSNISSISFNIPKDLEDSYLQQTSKIQLT